MERIKVNDTVIITTGKDKGRIGKIIKKIANNRVLVEGANLIKKHVKPNPDKQIQGGIIERESGVHVSNVALLNPATNKADRVGFKFLDNNQKVRYFKSNNELIDA